MKLLLTIIAATLMMTSCKFYQDIHFNEDWSGNASYTIDMTELMAMAGDENEEESDSSMFDSPEMQESLKELENTPGISNVKLEDDKKGKYIISFDFDNIDVLNNASEGANAALVQGQDGGEDGFAYFTVKKNKLTYQTQKMPETEEDDETAGMMGMVSSSMDFQVRMTFEKGVKKIKTNNGAELIGNKVVWKPDFEKLMKNEIDSKMVITLKK